MLTVQEFIKNYGDEKLEVTKNFTTKALGVNYDIKDAFIELCDNSLDARIDDVLNFSIEVSEITHQIIITDDGCGISEPSNLLKLGGTDKEKDTNKIGKYGIGVPGAISAIATKCVYDSNEIVEVVYSSACNGQCFNKHIAFTQNGDIVIGETTFDSCDNNEHYTKIVFSNVSLNGYGVDVIEALEETFEEPLITNKLNISLNKRQLGKSGIHTFIGDEKPESIKVGDFTVYVKYRVIGGEHDKSDKRSLRKSGLRVYDINTGRLLAINTDLWKWYADRAAQQNVCGLRCGIWIESSLESYKKFGIKSEKNGVTYKKYFNDPDFKLLSEKLLYIYNSVSKEQFNTKNNEVKLNGMTFTSSGGKMKDIYFITPDNSTVIFKKHLNIQEIAELISENINLKKKLEKKESKKKSA